MQLNIDGYKYGVTTGGYESAIPTNSFFELREAKYFARASNGGFDAEEVDLVDIFTSEICPGEPMFSVQFGRSDPANDHATYQVIGDGLPELQYAADNLQELFNEVEAEFDYDSDYTTHRPLVKAHTTLQDGSVLFVSVYYYGFSGETVKNFEVVTFHRNIPFGTTQYEGIFEENPVRTPGFLEEAEISTKTDFRIVGFSPDIVTETGAIQGSATDMAQIENPIQFHSRSIDVPWNAFESPNQLFAESYVYDEDYSDSKVTSLRAVSPEIIEPVFYEMEIE